MDQPTAEEALKRLEPLIGEWTLEATSPAGERWPGEARASFEWHESGAHVIARSSADLPEAPSVTAIIGCDAAKRDLLPALLPTTAASAASTR